MGKIKLNCLKKVTQQQWLFICSKSAECMSPEHWYSLRYNFNIQKASRSWSKKSCAIIDDKFKYGRSMCPDDRRFCDSSVIRKPQWLGMPLLGSDSVALPEFTRSKSPGVGPYRIRDSDCTVLAFWHFGQLDTKWVWHTRMLVSPRFVIWYAECSASSSRNCLLIWMCIAAAATRTTTHITFRLWAR